jgi:hypothetical protein
MSNRSKDMGTHRVYVILGTCHPLQWRGGAPSQSVLKKIDGLTSLIRNLVRRYKIVLIAEESPGPNCPCLIARQIAKDEGISYLEIDMTPQDAQAAGIRDEMDHRYSPTAAEDPCAEVRLSHADEIRENFWLDRIERTGASPVLVICGWAHTSFLASKVAARNNVVAEQTYFPPRLRDAKIVSK